MQKAFVHYLLFFIMFQPLSLLCHLLPPQIEEVRWVGIKLKPIFAIVPIKRGGNNMSTVLNLQTRRVQLA